MIAVVGSGPAGLACATALLERGEQVLILDGGNQLEPDRAAAVARMGTAEVEEWRPEDLALIKQQGAPNAGGLKEKLTYGSNFPFRDADQLLSLVRENVDGVASLAVGGFSNVWGASILPYRDADLVDWPFGLDALAPHYKAVAQMLPVSGEADDLEALFPLYTPSPLPLKLSRQGQALMADLDKHRGELGEAGITHGQARLAVRAEACRYCGLCMYGCPYGLIYRTTEPLQALVDRFAQEGSQHVSDWVVTSVEESGASVSVRAVHRTRSETRIFAVDRVFLAAGTFATTKILLSSMRAHDRELRILDSQHYLFPLLRRRGIPRVDDERLHTLAQIFVEILDPEISAYTVHLQLYSYNDLYTAVFRKMLGPLVPLLAPALQAFLGRLWFIQGYLHSAESPGIRATLRKSGNGDALALEGEADAGVRERVGRVIHKLKRHRSQLHAEPLETLLRMAHPGKSKHFGASFPMRRSPGPFESDILGRPHGFHRVHAVDASVLPSFPATTVTYSVMANAHRIGSSWRGES